MPREREGARANGEWRMANCELRIVRRGTDTRAMAGLGSTSDYGGPIVAAQSSSSVGSSPHSGQRVARRPRKG